MERIFRMKARRSSPKIKRRKRRSKQVVSPILQEQHDAAYFQPVPTPEEVYLSLRKSTLRIQRATDRFLDTIEGLKGEIATVMDLYSDQSHPVSNEMKDAVDEGFSRLSIHYYEYYLGTPEMDLAPLGEHTKALLLAFLAMPPLAANFCELASLCSALAHDFGETLLSTQDHAVALFHNILRYLEDGEALELLEEPVKVFFWDKRHMLRKLRFGRMRQLEVCRGTRMYDLLTQ